MTDKKEVSILLLGIVAILAIVGLVLLFTSPAATGRAYQPPPFPPSISVPANVASPNELNIPPNAILVAPDIPCGGLGPCPSGLSQTFQQHNIKQVGGQNYRIGVCQCPPVEGFPQTWVYMILP